MADIEVRDERSFLKYKKRTERELRRLRIENSIAVMLRDMEKSTGELMEHERQRSLTATYTGIITENSTDRFILLDEHLRLLLLSHNFETGAMSALKPGTSLEDLLHVLPNGNASPESIAAFRAALEHIMITGETVKHAMTLGEGDDARYFDATAKGVTDSGSGHRGVVLTFTECTALTRAMQEVQAADRAKSAFLANMSHEIRTPINAIVGISEIALARGGLSAEMQSDLTVIQNAASGLLSIINDILDFSKIESGKFQIVPAEYTLPSLLMDISNMICVKLANTQVRLLMNVDASLPFHLYGDDIRVKQILTNLLNNACKFTRTGYIELRVNGERLPDDRVRLVIHVIDTGIGIKKEDLGKLFGTFSQVDTRRNRAISGSGLGLAISRNLAMAMGGNITVQSEYGSGSDFTVTLIQEVRGTQPIGTVKDRDKIRVLVVEDDEVLLDSIGRTLTGLGVAWQACRSSDRIRSFTGFTHALLLRKNFETWREKLEFMFESSNIFLILDQGEIATPARMDCRQLLLPLLSLQLINALNGQEIVSSMKKSGFDRAQIIPLTYARVLIVDDNATNLQVAKGLMAPYKMQIDTAPSGFKAIEMVRSTKYDAVFMDHMMPEMDGVEATQYIRSLDGDYFKTVPIIALTANAMSDAREMFLRSGMDDFISKPIEIVQLNRVIKKFIESKAPAGYLEAYRKSREQETAAAAVQTPAVPGAQPLPGTPAPQTTPAVPGTAAPAGWPLSGSPLPADLLGGLLQQNNLLLSQNTVLLQQLLNLVGPHTAAPAAPAAEPAFVCASVPAPAPASPAPVPAAPAATADTQAGGEGDDGIPGVNMASAIEGCGGSKEVYEEILKTYREDLKDRIGELESLYAAHDIKNFTIAVHALKSASRSVGAADLGEAAWSLEQHGRAGEWDAIAREYPAFASALAGTERQVGAYLDRHAPAAPAEAADEKEQRSAFDPEAVKRLRTACTDMDYMQAEDILHELDAFSYPAPLAETLADMLRACADFDYDKLEALAAGLAPAAE